MSTSVVMNGEKYTVINMKCSVWNYVKKIKAENGDVLGYKVLNNLAYESIRYNKWIVIEAGDRSDGATYAKDINSFVWLFHDELKASGVFADGSECTNWQASMVAGDILKASGRWIRRYSWLLSTWIFGEVKASFTWVFGGVKALFK